jgi:predicted trehalose synthase
MIIFLRSLFVVIIASMLGITSWAGSQQSLSAFAHSATFRDPWVIATLFDAYWAFITFYAWVAWKEQSLVARLLWFVAIVLLGNLVMSAYMLVQLFAAPAAGSIAVSPASAPPSAPAGVRATTPTPPASSAAMSASASTPHASFLTLVAMIGQRTGELHLALAATSGDPAFDPEPVSTDDIAAWIAAVVAEVDQTFDQLAQRQGDLPPPVHGAAERLLAMREGLKSRITALAPRVLTFTKTRFHGDFHLGQLLVVEHDFIIVDFEGEPFRPLDERRRKHSPLRDVAGMLRSFSYAAAIALDEATGDRPGDRVRAAAHMSRWERETAGAFLTAYARAARGASSYPSDPVDVARLTDLFVLEKALYEVRYELGSRPDWVRIPIAGLLERMQVAAAIS